MATADPAALDQFISAFTGQVGSGFGAIAGPVQGVLATLVVISITISAILWAIDETQNIMAALVRKILLIGFFAWLVTNWHSLTLTVINGFAKLGLQASGGGSIGDFTRAPTKAVEAGLSVVIDLIKYIGDLAQQNAGFGALMHIDMIIVAAVAAIGILLVWRSGQARFHLPRPWPQRRCPGQRRPARRHGEPRPERRRRNQTMAHPAAGEGAPRLH